MAAKLELDPDAHLRRRGAAPSTRPRPRARRRSPRPASSTSSPRSTTPTPPRGPAATDPGPARLPAGTLPHGCRVRLRSRPVRLGAGPRPTRCSITTTSSQRPNLRPTSRSRPTTANPQDSCSRSTPCGRRRCGRTRRGTRGCRPGGTARRPRAGPRRCGGGRRGRRPSSRPTSSTRAGAGSAAERAERHDPAVELDDDRRVPAAVLVEPAHLVVERAGDEVEGDEAARDLEVVDGADPLGVTPFGQADRGRGRGARGRRGGHGPARLPAPGRGRRPGGGCYDPPHASLAQ